MPEDNRFSEGRFADIGRNCLECLRGRQQRFAAHYWASHFGGVDRRQSWRLALASTRRRVAIRGHPARLKVSQEGRLGAMTSLPSKNQAYALLWLTWMGGLAYSAERMLRYSYTPGAVSTLNKGFPAKSRLSLDRTRDSIFVFIHPKCSCTRATLYELGKLDPVISNRMKLVIIFDQPIGKSSNWVKSDNWKMAKEIPNSELFIDEGSQEFDRFEVKTSGQTFLFSKEGTLLFSGGITQSRGHVGDSRGQRLILERARNGTTPYKSAPVYGCATKNSKLAEK